MLPAPLCSAPTCWWQMQVSGGTFLLGVAFRHIICGFYLFSPPSQVALGDSKTSPRPTSARVSWCLETSSIKIPFPDGSPSLALLSLFLSFIFCPTSFWRQWVTFLGACWPQLAIRSCLWSLLCVWLFFWWICRRESGLPILFLHHLGSSPIHPLFSIILLCCSNALSWQQRKQGELRVTFKVASKNTRCQVSRI